SVVIFSGLAAFFGLVLMLPSILYLGTGGFAYWGWALGVVLAFVGIAAIGIPPWDKRPVLTEKGTLPTPNLFQIFAVIFIFIVEFLFAVFFLVGPSMYGSYSLYSERI